MRVVGVKFRDHGRIYDYDSTAFVLKERDIVMVETEHGPELGFVARTPLERDPAFFTKPLKKVLRLASEADMEQGRRNLARERDAKKLCLAKIQEHKLPMKLIEVESFLEGGKIIVRRAYAELQGGEAEHHGQASSPARTVSSRGCLL